MHFLYSYVYELKHWGGFYKWKRLYQFYIEPKGKTEFTYDDVGRIKTVLEPDGKITSYTYDSYGNRKTQRTEGEGLLVDIQYIYDSSNRLVKTIEMKDNTVINTEYNYDNNGNQTSVKQLSSEGNKTSTYEYDGFNQMVKSKTPEGKSLTCNYDAQGLRVSKTVDGKTTNYYYRYSSVILEKTDTSSIRNVVGVNIIARKNQEDILYYIYNGHGDVIEMQSAGGSIVNEYDYDIFGNPILENEAEGKENPYRYAGYYWDKETEYYYLRARYYNPETARFITEDSFKGYYDDPLSLNLYTYCMNSPIKYWDPDGRYYVPDPVTGEKIHASEWESRRNFRVKVRDSQGRGVSVSTGVSAYDWALQNKVNKGTGKTLITAQHLIDIGWNKRNIDIDEINRILVKYEINTTERIQHFITQVTYESGYGKYTREGEYLLDPPYNFTQEKYEAYYNKKSNYKYKDRGVGYIQTTFNYQHKFFAIDMFREEYPQYELSKVAYNHPEAIDPVYNEMLKIAKNNNLNIKHITDINDLGTDYIAKNYSWEITGWWWKQHNANELVDNSKPGDVDSVSRLVNKYDTPSFSARRDIYKKVIDYIK